MPNPKPLIYQKGACVYEKENPTNPFNVTIVFVLHTDHICSELRLPGPEATTVKFKTSYTNSKESHDS